MANKPTSTAAKAAPAIAVVRYIVLALLAVVFILPFVWMISTAFKTPEQTVAYPPSFIPHPFTLRGFAEGFDGGMFGLYIRNSLIITISCIVGNVLSSAIVGFGFARLYSRYKQVFFIILLGTLMIPSNVTLIPVYGLYSRLGWINTYIPLILPSFLGGSAFFIFLMRQFFVGIPKDLEEAAKIDGCSLAGILVRIFVPISLPAFLIVAIFTFVGTWNDFFGPMIFLNDSEKFTLAVGLNFFKNQYGGAMDMGPLMAMSVISIIPVLLLFLVAQKYFVQGIATTGIK